MERKLYYFWLSGLEVFGREQLRRMIASCGDITELFEISGRDLNILGETVPFDKQVYWDEHRDPERILKEYEALTERKIQYFSEEDPAFPEMLSCIPDPPFGLFVKGSLPEPDIPSAAVVGARTCSAYGKEMAYFFGRELAAKGVNIISGMALGIDGASQRGALSADGRTYAVLGGGADVCYPRENIGLYTEIPEKGGVISERPPGYQARAKDFPIRNRIISGLSDCTIVIEAAEHSGSLITVRHALEQNKEVFALPGRVTDRLSRGCNELLKNGAQVLTCPEDVLQYLGISVKQETFKKSRAVLTAEEKTIYDCFGTDTLSMDELLEKSGFPAGMLTEVLLRLEIKGLIRKEDLSGYLRI